jgi:predicted Zn-dependent protease
MNKMKRCQIVLIILCFCLASVPLANVSPLTVPARAQSRETFKFTKVDLDLLEQVNLLDKRFEKEGVVYNDDPLNAYLDRVGKSVLPADARLEHVEWRFRVLRDPIPNAIALPNGSVYVNSGLLALLDNEAQLASVFAHEVVHVLNRHTYLHNRSTRKKILAINIIQAIGFWNPVGGAAGLAINLMANISPLILEASIFGYSRELEREADIEGLNLLAQANYATPEMVNSFKLLKKDIEGEQLKYFYSDHPQLDERIKYVNNIINSKTLKSTSDKTLETTPAEYLSTIEKAARHDVQLAINSGRFRTAVYVSKKLVEFNPRSSENLYYLAESYRTLGPRAPELTDKELTTGAKKRAAKKREKYTPEEEEAELLATTAGQENWKANQQKAEYLYVQALEHDPANYAAHRGLGMLYEKAHRNQEAVREYQKYLDLAPNAPDKERIKRRLETLKGPTSPGQA